MLLRRCHSLQRHASTTASSAAALLRYEVASNGVAEITMTSSRNRNALSSAMIAALSDTIARAEAHDRASALIIAAEGPAWCAGHDLKELQSLQASGSQEGAAMLFRACSDLMLQLQASPMIVIAAINGVATAAGLQLAATCDMVVAHEHATFATPGINIGLFCTTPAVALTRAVGRNVATEMLFTGEPKSANSMLAAGLVNYVTQTDARTRALELASVVASKPRAVVALGKRALQSVRAAPAVQAAYEGACGVMADNLTREPDSKEGIAAFLGKRSPQFKNS